MYALCITVLPSYYYIEKEELNLIWKYSSIVYSIVSSFECFGKSIAPRWLWATSSSYLGCAYSASSRLFSMLRDPSIHQFVRLFRRAASYFVGKSERPWSDTADQISWMFLPFRADWKNSSAGRFHPPAWPIPAHATRSPCWSIGHARPRRRTNDAFPSTLCTWEHRRRRWPSLDCACRNRHTENFRRWISKAFGRILEREHRPNECHWRWRYCDDEVLPTRWRLFEEGKDLLCIGCMSYLFSSLWVTDFLWECSLFFGRIVG